MSVSGVSQPDTATYCEKGHPFEQVPRMLVGLDAENNVFGRKAQLGSYLEIKGDQKKHLYT